MKTVFKVNKLESNGNAPISFLDPSGSLYIESGSPILIQGELKVGDDVEIKPGYKVESHGKVNWVPLQTKITGMKTGKEDIKSAVPGGSIALMTTLDPSII